MTSKYLLRTCLLLVLAALFLNGATCEQPAGMDNDAAPSLGKVNITDVGVPAPNQIKITADQSFKASPFTLTDPLRIGVDIKNASYEAAQPVPISGGGVIDRVEVTTDTAMLRSIVRVTAYLRANATYKMEVQDNASHLFKYPVYIRAVFC